MQRRQVAWKHVRNDLRVHANTRPPARELPVLAILDDQSGGRPVRDQTAAKDGVTPAGHGPLNVRLHHRPTRRRVHALPNHPRSRPDTQNPTGRIGPITTADPIASIHVIVDTVLRPAVAIPPLDGSGRRLIAAAGADISTTLEVDLECAGCLSESQPRRVVEVGWHYTAEGKSSRWEVPSGAAVQ